MKLQRQLGMLIVSGLAISCGATDENQAQQPDIATASQAISGTVAFGEAAVAPKTPSGNALNFTKKNRVRAVEVQGNYVYVGGDFTITTGSGLTFTNLAKFQIPSTPSSPLVLVTAFNPKVNAPVWAIAASAGAVFVGGEFSTINSTSRSGLARLDPTTGAVNTTFSANLGTAANYTCASPCSEPPNYAKGVHALALANYGRTGEPGEVIVGGNFTTIKGVTRYGLASVSPSTGDVSATNYTTGVTGGYVHVLQGMFNDMYVGGRFSQTTDGVNRSGLFRTDLRGVAYGDVYPGVGSVLDVDIDWGNLRVVVGSSNNRVMAFYSGGGDPIWMTPAPMGDVQAVKYFDGNVYFGFHDGLTHNTPGNGVSGDQYKLAAVAADTGAPLTDKTHTGACDWFGATPDDCWLPNNDSADVGVTKGIWGVWSLATYSDANGSRLIVGGDVNKWGTVTSPLLTSFASQ